MLLQLRHSQIVWLRHYKEKKPSGTQGTMHVMVGQISGLYSTVGPTKI